MTSAPGKVLFVSNAPWIGSGYGVQAKLFSGLMHKDGYEVVNFGFFGHRGPQIDQGGVITLPMSQTPNGEDMIAEHQKAIGPDATIILYDVWTYAPTDLEKWDCAVWMPVDHDPVPPFVEQRLDYMRNECIWVYTRWAQDHLRSRGYDSVYVPLAVDTEAFYPMDRSAARMNMAVDADIFLAAMVGANQTIPDRKAFDRSFAAWGNFIKKHPKSLLYVHTYPTKDRGGHDLLAMARFYGIEHHIRFPNPYAFNNSRYNETHLNWLYNAADVLLMPSRTEGFGVPAVEAQAAGCPVIVCDFGAQTELGEAGYKVRIDADDKLYTIYGSEIANPRVNEIYLQLDIAHYRRTNKKVRERAVEFARQYDYRAVWREHFKPALDQLIEIERDRDRRSDERYERISQKGQIDAEIKAAVG